MSPVACPLPNRLKLEAPLGKMRRVTLSDVSSGHCRAPYAGSCPASSRHLRSSSERSRSARSCSLKDAFSSSYECLRVKQRNSQSRLYRCACWCLPPAESFQRNGNVIQWILFHAYLPYQLGTECVIHRYSCHAGKQRQTHAPARPCETWSVQGNRFKRQSCMCRELGEQFRSRWQRTMSF